MANVHIKMTGKLRGKTQFVTLNSELGQADTSKESWDEATLRSNAEVMSFHAKAYIVFVTEDQYETERKAAQEASALASIAQTKAEEGELSGDTVTIEDAVEHDHSKDDQLRVYAKTAADALAKLSALLAPQAKTPPKVDFGPKVEEKSDGLDLPMSVPVGMQPKAHVQQYLSKKEPERRAFIKQCADIGFLREIAMFETHGMLKKMARVAARRAESTAQEATNMAQTAL